MSSSTTTARSGHVTSTERTGWAIAVVVGGLLLPGLGLVIGLVLAFTRFRGSSGLARWGLVGLGTVLVVVQVVGLVALGGTSGSVSPIVPAG